MSDKHYLFPDWPAPKEIKAATTLRTGGVSKGVFDSLNVALHVGDDAAKVKQNRVIVKDMLNLPSEPIWLQQVHGNQVINAGQTMSDVQADASFTDRAGVVCAVMTADCLPLLVCTNDGCKIAAIHAGWRGLLAGIIANTVTALGSLELCVWLGPAIGAECFEVGEEVRNAFVKKSSAFSEAFKAHDQGKWVADIYQLARIELASLGVFNVFGGNFCTVIEKDRFYSYRRDLQTGRMVTLIWRD